MASPSPGAAPLFVPCLTGPHDLVYSADHVRNGHVYVFADLSTRASPETRAGTPILRDLDRDGTIDDFVLAHVGNVAELGLDDHALFR